MSFRHLKFISLFSSIVLLVSICTLDTEKKTYYLSSSGTSKEGLSEDDPMSITTFKKDKINYIKTGDKILFKCGDYFYEDLQFKVIKEDDEITVLSSYGDCQLGQPVISGYKIVSKKESWELYRKNEDNKTIYKIDLKDTSKYTGNQNPSSSVNDLAFIEDVNRKKYYKRKKSLDDVVDLYDFYFDGDRNLYVKTNGNSPYEELGVLKLASNLNLIVPSSNMKIQNLHIMGSGGNGIKTLDDYIENLEIFNNTIEDIGGNYIGSNIGLGNAIFFPNNDVKNSRVHHNIVRNVDNAAFTIQSKKGSVLNVSVDHNIFCYNNEDSEITQGPPATGIYNYYFEDNISLMQGRGWGYEARKSKVTTAFILFWNYYQLDNIYEITKMYFRRNFVYNPRRLYYIQHATDSFFKEKGYIISDNNTYYVTEDISIFRDDYNYASIINFSNNFNKDENSKFMQLEKSDSSMEKMALTCTDYETLRAFVERDINKGSIFANDYKNRMKILKSEINEANKRIDSIYDYLNKIKNAASSISS